MAESFAKQLRGADAAQVAQVLRQEIRSWCRGKIWGRVFGEVSSLMLFFLGENGSRLQTNGDIRKNRQELVDGYKAC